MERVPLKLNEVAASLENIKTEKYPNGLAIAQNFGNHVYCSIDSNCPEAIKLRKILSEAELSIDEVNTAYNEFRAPAPDPPVNFHLPSLRGSVTVFVNERPVEVDIGDNLEEQVRQGMFNKWTTFQRSREQFNSLGRDLFHSYLYYINEARKTKALIQLNFPLEEVLKYGVYCTTNGKDCYLFIYPFTYAPEYIYAKDERYRISKEDREKIRRDVYLVITITSGMKVMIPHLINANESKFIHYHADEARDCWGGTKLPEERWNKSLKFLFELKLSLESALVTINRNSPLTSRPRGMPTLEDLLNRSKKLGKEGEVSGIKDIDEEQPENVSPKKSWGEERANGN